MGELPLDDDGRMTVAGNLWANGLAGFSEPQILGTLAYYVEIGSSWPPNLPQVRKHCAGIPELARVRQELLGREPKRTGFARLVWSYLDTYQLARVDQDKADRMIRDAYDLAVENLLSGRVEVPQESPAVTHEEAEPYAPDPNTPPARQSIAEIGLLLKTGGAVLTEEEAAIQHANSARTIQDDLEDLERASEPDFRRLAAGDVE